MPAHEQKRVVPFDASQMFDLVADIVSYPEFLPWCAGARVRKREPAEDGREIVLADLIIAYKMLRGTYTSRVTLDPGQLRIDVAHARGPFRRLQNHWLFVPQADGSCEIDFFIDFEFNSRLIQKMMDTVFAEGMRRIIHAFEQRAAELYAPVGQLTAST